MLIDLDAKDVSGPLGQFQHVTPVEQDFRRLLRDPNDLVGETKLSEERLDRAFDTHWPRLGQALTEARGSAGDDADAEVDEAPKLLEEVLSISRSNAATLDDISRRLPARMIPEPVLRGGIGDLLVPISAPTVHRSGPFSRDALQLADRLDVFHLSDRLDAPATKNKEKSGEPQGVEEAVRLGDDPDY